MNNIFGIIDIEYLFPNNTIDSRSIISELNTSDIKKHRLYENSGIQEVFCWGDVDIICALSKMVLDILKRNHQNPTDIRTIYFCNYDKSFVKGDISIPFCIKEMCGLRNATISFVDQICASTIFSFDIEYQKSKYYLQKSSLVISLNLMKSSERLRNFTIAGDGCAVGLVGSEDVKYEILSSKIESFGILSYQKYLSSKEIITDLQIAKVATDHIKSHLSNCNLKVNDIYSFIPQNTNIMQLQIFARLLKINMEKIFTTNIENGGHIGDADTMRNIKDFYMNNQVNELCFLYASGLFPSGDIVFASNIIRKVG